MQERLLMVFMVAIIAVTGVLVTTPGDVFLPSQPAVTERPVINVPRSLRQDNWLQNGEGSCVHASLVSLFRWQNKAEFANWWKKNHGGGEYISTAEWQLNQAGVVYASTSKRNDVRFLEWACRTRRGAGISVRGGTHMVALVHLDDKWAAILDNNHTDKFLWAPRDVFLAEWEASGSWAVTPLYTPCPPLPR